MPKSLEEFNPEYEEEVFEKKEKPKFLYHGSSSPDIKELEPRKGHRPDGKDLKRIFASDLPVFAAAHGFSWATAEGFELLVENERVIFKVPTKFKPRLMHKLYLYTFPPDDFDWTRTERTGHTWDSKKNIKPLKVQEFSSVQAIEHFGGEVIYLKDDKKG